VITPAQIGAARALLGWKQTDLATASGVSEIAIKIPCDAPAETSAFGTELPIRNASAPAAIGGKADPDQITLDKLDF